MAETLTSPQNPKIKELLALEKESRERKARGLFVVEGRREFERAVAAGFEPVTVFVREGETEAPQADFFVSPRVYEKIAYREGTEGVIAVLRALAGETGIMVGLERVPGLMCQHVDVCGGAVEIGEDKRRLVFRQRGTITAEVLVLARHEIEQLVFGHEIKEFYCLGRKIGVHLARLFHKFFRRSDGRCVAVGKHKLFVVIAQFIDA